MIIFLIYKDNKGERNIVKKYPDNVSITLSKNVTLSVIKDLRTRYRATLEDPSLFS